MRKMFLLSAGALWLSLVPAIAGWAQATETVLYSFTNGSDGGSPLAGLVFDSAGNLYGTASTGGLYDQGAVFKLSETDNGWMETVLYSFTGRSDGGNPAAGLVMSKTGNIFGTTLRGGAYSGGSVFELYQTRTGWRETVLHSFGDGGDGASPSGLIVDKEGRAFGTTEYGGTYGAGTVFGARFSQGAWQYATLYSFNNNGTDGYNPAGGVIVGRNENLYGTTANGGHGRGTVFEITYSPSGWTEKIIYDFEGGNDGTTPFQGLIIDNADNLYGTTYLGGTNNDGTIFELSPIQRKGWSKATIYNATDPLSPLNTGVLTFDQFGDLYGETQHTIFKLTPSDGEWIASTLFQFDNTDGYWPNGGLIFDQAGDLYGTTVFGGTPFGVGVAFEITP